MVGLPISDLLTTMNIYLITDIVYVPQITLIAL